MTQSVTNNLALGGEGYWLGHHRKSGIGFAARYNTEKVVCMPEIHYYLFSHSLLL
jgi:mitochondrial import receptor subunit TOM40